MIILKEQASVPFSHVGPTISSAATSLFFGAERFIDFPFDYLHTEILVHICFFRLCLLYLDLMRYSILTRLLRVGTAEFAMFSHGQTDAWCRCLKPRVHLYWYTHYDSVWYYAIVEYKIAIFFVHGSRHGCK